jgi:hypothetical protein
MASIQKLFRARPALIKSWLVAKGYPGELTDALITYFQTKSGLTTGKTLFDHINKTVNAFGYSGTLGDQLRRFFTVKTGKENPVDAENSFWSNTSLDFSLTVPGIDQYTMLMLHMDGADGGTTFTDSSTNQAAKTVTAAGSAHTEIDQFKFGTASGQFNGNTTNDYLTTPSSTDFNFGSGDFTIDCWIRSADVTNWASDRGAIIGWPVAAGAESLVFGIRDTAYTFWFTASDGVTACDVRASGVSFSNNTWYHVAVVRASGVVTFYKDGIAQTNTTNSNPNLNLPAISNSVVIGNQNVGTPAQNNSFNGFIDELRVSKGIARWTGNFTPPSQAYT